MSQAKVTSVEPDWGMSSVYFPYPVSLSCDSLFPSSLFDVDVQRMQTIPNITHDPVDYDVLLNDSTSEIFPETAHPSKPRSTHSDRDSHSSSLQASLSICSDPGSDSCMESPGLDAAKLAIEGLTTPNGFVIPDSMKSFPPMKRKQSLGETPTPYSYIPSSFSSLAPSGPISNPVKPKQSRGIPNCGPILTKKPNTVTVTPNSSSTNSDCVPATVDTNLCERKHEFTDEDVAFCNGEEPQSASKNAHATHLTSEKKRRDNLGTAFLDLKQTIPSCRNTPGMKRSKEGTIRCAIAYIGYLLNQRSAMSDEILQLRTALELHGVPIPPTNNNTTESAQSLTFDSGVVNISPQKGNALPASTLMLLFLGLFDAFYEEFMKRVSTSSPEELSMSLLAYLQQQVSAGKIQQMFLTALSSMSENFSPSTDGSTCRIRKWMDMLDACNIAGYDDTTAGKIRSILCTIKQYLR